MSLSIFTFRTRSAGRDRETDNKRFQSLCASLDYLLEQIRTEEAGLRRRYGQVRDQAAFALQSYDNDGTGRLSAKVERLTQTLAQCEARLTALKAQSDFLGTLREQTGAQESLWH